MSDGMNDRTRELECVIIDLKQQVRDAEKVRDDLLEFVAEWLSRQGNDKNYMTEKVRAAIAKATGEQK